MYKLRVSAFAHPTIMAAVMFCSLVDSRKYFEPALPADTVGNYVNGIPQTQQAKEGVAFWDLARSVSATSEKDISKSKQFSEIPVLNLLFSQVCELHPKFTPVLTTLLPHVSQELKSAVGVCRF